MNETGKKNKAHKKQSAEEIARAMAENMKENMKDPNFDLKRNRELSALAHQVLLEDGLLPAEDLSEEDRVLVKSWEKTKKKDKKTTKLKKEE